MDISQNFVASSGYLNFNEFPDTQTHLIFTSGLCHDTECETFWKNIRDAIKFSSDFIFREKVNFDRFSFRIEHVAATHDEQQHTANNYSHGTGFTCVRFPTVI